MGNSRSFNEVILWQHFMSGRKLLRPLVSVTKSNSI